MKTKKPQPKPIPIRTYVYSISILIFFILILNLMYRTNTVFANTYSNLAYPYFVRIVGTLCSLVPFSVFEAFILLLIAGLLGTLGRLLYLLIKYHNRQYIFLFYHQLKKSLLNLVCLTLSLILIYSLTCGINYYRLSFSTSSNIKTGTYTEEQLNALANLLIRQGNEYVSSIDLDENGHFTIDKIHAGSLAVSAMTALSLDYPCLTDYYPEPKPVFFSKLMSYGNITGIYSPFTAEANYNNDVPDLEKPYVMCHELSHLSGFMQEEEANFIAYLACIKSDSADFGYSGTVNVLITVLNQVYSVLGTESYEDLVAKMDPQILTDLKVQNEYWSQFDTPVAKAANQVNNSYLQSNGQEDGVQSYGRVTDLLLSYYEDQLTE